MRRSARRCEKSSPAFCGSPPRNHSGYPRVGKPVLIFPRNKPVEGKNALEIYGLNGKTLAIATIWAYNGPYGATYYVGQGTGETASQLAAEARRNGGRARVYVDIGRRTCVGPVDPTLRSGSL